ncbi:ubiquitin carboxyl-terminal hydrolase 47 [Toxorhynchites rutilus septentrionalis]|uniref:ubiquitin carboxyl-terminal hydrolase 47 n=1 Tax=Toxorhynchites rutilus septentrionalis TaxID=329112 RepID=UPI002479D8EF|nr:ubiquitin carboxyl-terminal hydrolase 47 [Toxorhynchites rutilus septentrionalis]XP_055620916.1 ubiquitin carboxyl-terminal hydrolase 47 [Toxorhynchites rutilus septentrionalis]
MVCAEDEALCIIKDPLEGAKQRKFIVTVRSHYTVANLYEHVALSTVYPDFELVLPIDEKDNTTELTLHDKRRMKLSDAGIKFGVRNTVIIIPKGLDYSSPNISIETEMSFDDDLAVGASASPVESSNYNMPAPPPLPAPLFDSTVRPVDKQYTLRHNGEHSQSASHNYRGLVNQAMTCYLNSLLQALFMTPEFRNALYNWEFDGKDEAKSIPYQLQKLFVNLQTSPKSAVETTDLTRSFGWDSAEGWQQHDIQELCRVMFDALEQKFKNTKQADLINRLYEGKMIDYVKCLECNTEKKREDKFLDIPLPVRPFGSTVAYESIEEALRAFVQPEILEGNNQYHCETCDKKCDAHKGLKFTKFPYILTLHLKRFDFDYKTFHRIKLNDKVTFPQALNLNNFVNAVPQVGNKCTMLSTETVNGVNGGLPGIQMETAENFMKTFDECSTTDSGSALEEDSSFQNGTSVSSTTTTPNDHFITQDDDEGIDMELNGDCKSPSTSNFDAPGPYEYELFAIMIHSGSASGGHYYAYIRDFTSCHWYSFNDQTVSSITQDDIQKSFGGGSSKTYYSGAYSSSTNAYMLMYRQRDSDKNSTPISEDEFPEHIKSLVSKIRMADAERSKFDSDMRVKVYFANPKTRNIESYKMYLLNESSLAETLEEAYRCLNVKGVVPIERCRLVAYDRQREVIEKSFEGDEDKLIGDVLRQLERSNELLLETREEHEVFEPYLPDGVMTKLYRVDICSRDVDGPISIRASKNQTVLDYKMIIARKFLLNPKSITLALNEYKNGSRILLDNEATLRDEGFIEYCKVFVTVNNAEDTDFPNKFRQVASKLDHVIALYFVLPKMDPDTLKNMYIPRFVPKPLSQAPPATMNGCASDAQMASNDSNSEDSSLSDNDRTLVEDDVHAQLNGDVSNLHFTNGVSTNGFTSGDDDDEEESYLMECRKNDYYFKVTPANFQSPAAETGTEDDSGSSSSSSESEKVIKVLIDKRASHGCLKYRLQSYLNVPMEYFKLFKNSGVSQQEITVLKEELNTYTDGDRLTIELGRVLRKGEYKVNIYYFNLNEMTEDAEKLPLLCPWIVRNGQLVGNIKRDILAHLAAGDSKYSTLTYERCRLRKKFWKSISKVCTDDQKIGDNVQLTSSSDMILQEVDDLASVTPSHYNDVVIMVRRWLPSERKLAKIDEILFPNKCELKSLLSKLSGIPDDNLEYFKLQRRDSVSLLELHDLPQWTSMPMRSDLCDSDLQDGNMLYYRDKTEVLLELTAEERKELTKKDIRSSSTYSPRKERALKIYVDASPKKADD